MNITCPNRSKLQRIVGLSSNMFLLFVSLVLVVHVVESQNDKFADMFANTDVPMFNGGEEIDKTTLPQYIAASMKPIETVPPTEAVTFADTVGFNGTTKEPYVDDQEALMYLRNGSSLLNVIDDLAGEEFDENGLTFFRDALRSVGMFDQLMDSDLNSNLTVFAPTNGAIKNDVHFRLYMKGMSELPNARWYRNLQALLQYHIVPNRTLHTAEMFNDKSNETAIRTMLQDESLLVARSMQRISGGNFIQRNIETVNGILHIVDSVLQPSFLKDSLSSLELQPEYGPDVLQRTSLVDVVKIADKNRATLSQIVDSGLTFTGCRIRAFNRLEEYLPQTINYSRNVTIGELVNASFAEQTRINFIQYNLIPRNIYFEDIPNGYHDLVFPLSKRCAAHMWITKRNDQLCFNNGCVILSDSKPPVLRSYLASNGVGYVIDKCQVCMGVAMLAGVAAEYTMYNLRDTSQLFVASEWNLRDLRQSVGNGKADITLFASISSGWNTFNLEDVTRLASDEWNPHKLDLLRHMLVQGRYTYADLHAKFVADGPFNLTSLANETLTFDFSVDEDSLTVADGIFIYKDIQGVDGLMHFVDQVPLPRSITHTGYDYAAEKPQFSTQVRLIDTVQLTEDMKRLLPLTVFFAPNEEWENKIIEINDISKTILENMIFKKLLWCNTLRKMVGQYAESHNQKYWNITVDKETNMPCIEYSESSEQYNRKRSCVTKCDILVRNGLFHEVDTLILYENPETLPPRAEGMRIPGMDGDKYEQMLKENINKTVTSTDLESAKNDEAGKFQNVANRAPNDNTASESSSFKANPKLWSLLFYNFLPVIVLLVLTSK